MKIDLASTAAADRYLAREKNFEYKKVHNSIVKIIGLEITHPIEVDSDPGSIETGKFAEIVIIDGDPKII